jgi:pseudaminic acid cytidylyltransferase
MIAAIIPARGGSKRIPGKNIKSFFGKPVIAWSIEAAKTSGLFDRIVVSTDSPEIATVARKYGAETPFTRPVELSDDFTPTAPVLRHAIEWLNANGPAVTRLCCIYATAPFVRPGDLQEGLRILDAHRATSAFSVTTFPFPIQRALRLTEEGWMAMLWPEYKLTRSNDLPETYHDAGQFYWLDAGLFLIGGCLYAEDSRPVILPRYRVQDLDTPEDWERAEHMFAVLHPNKTLEMRGHGS